MLSRRTFLKTTPLIALAPTAPAFLAQTALAATAEPDRRILVVIQLDGGNDGINTVIPLADEGYAKNRQELRIAADKMIQLSDQVGLHPAMRPAADLVEDGQLAIVQAVGYPNPNRSHVRSMAIWHTARFRQEQHGDQGWLGRALDGGERPSSGGPDAIYVGSEALPVALRGRRCASASMASTEDLALRLPIGRLAGQAKTRAGGGDVTAFVRRTVLEAYTTANQLSKTTGPSNNPSAPYPGTQLAQQLKLVARLIKTSAGARVYYTSQSGYDTHAVQMPTHDRLLRELSGALKAFLDDLSACGLAERILVFAFSEFGRRVKENRSLGTDHGTAGPVLLAGPQVTAGLVGGPPSLTDLEDGDLKMQFDFRQIYATLLQQWLGVKSKLSLGGQFEPVPVIRST